MSEDSRSASGMDYLELLLERSARSIERINQIDQRLKNIEAKINEIDARKETDNRALSDQAMDGPKQGR